MFARSFLIILNATCYLIRPVVDSAASNARLEVNIIDAAPPPRLRNCVKGATG